MLAFQQHAEFGVEEPCGGETASRRRARRHMPGRVTVPMTDVALRMASTGLPYLGSETPDARSASPKLDASHCPSSLESPVGSVRQSCPKNRNVSAGLGLVRIADPPGRRSVGGRKPSFSPPPFLRLRSGSCSVYDVENVFQLSVVPVAVSK